MVNSWTNQQPEKTYKRTNRVQIQRNFIIQRAFDGIMCNIDNCFNIHSKCFLVLNKLTSAKILFETFSPTDTPQKVDHIYRGRCFAYSRISSETQLFRLRKAVDAIFYFTINQAALLPSEYTIDQPRFQANIPSNRWYIACNSHCTRVPYSF